MFFRGVRRSMICGVPARLMRAMAAMGFMWWSRRSSRAENFCVVWLVA